MNLYFLTGSGLIYCKSSLTSKQLMVAEFQIRSLNLEYNVEQFSLHVAEYLEANVSHYN